MDRIPGPVEIPERAELIAQYCALTNASRVLSEVLANIGTDDQLRDFVLKVGTFSMSGLLELNRRLILDTEYAAMWLFSSELSYPQNNDPKSSTDRINHLLESEALSVDERRFVEQLERFIGSV